MVLSFSVLKQGCLQHKDLYGTSIIVRGVGRSLTTSVAKPPVVRFAPSPTGHLHLGGLRTALFNYLFARKHGGTFILRVEDTDKKRHVPGAVESIQDILEWTGLHYDEGPNKPAGRGPYVQSERLDKYIKYSEQLIRSGNAYRDFRDAGKEEGGSQRLVQYIPPDDEEASRLIQAGSKYVVRLRLPKQTTQVNDLTYGLLKFPYDRAIDDPIILKSDCWPTYHLASVVDDAEMGITHVMRGEEWLPSLPIHIALYSNLGFKLPEFAHLPLLMNPDGSKLSKRHGDVHVDVYRREGYEPEALVNFVALMGFNWHTGSSHSLVDTKEILKMDEMIKRFSIERVSQSRAVPNFSKLQFLNRQYFASKLADTKERSRLIERVQNHIAHDWNEHFPRDRLDSSRLGMVMDIMIGRSNTTSEIIKGLQELFRNPDWPGREAQQTFNSFDPRVYADALSRFSKSINIQHAEDLDETSFNESLLKEVYNEWKKQPFVNELPKEKRRKAAILQPIRYALTGKPSGPTVAEIIAILGKRRVLERLNAVEPKLHSI